MMLSGCKLTLQRFSAFNSNMTVRHGGSIKVILLQNLPDRGGAGAVIKVKRGYARNFLIPKKLAAYGTEANQIKYSDLIKSASPSVDTVEGAVIRNIRFERSSTLTGGLFGSVTAADIIAFFAEKNQEVKNVEIQDDVIKSVGNFVVKVDGVNVNVEVAAKAQ